MNEKAVSALSWKGRVGIRESNPVCTGMTGWMGAAQQHCVDRHNVDWNHNVPGNTPVWGWHIVW